jgi:HPt (histidine-containing phosphotransfer) domain-containing protein
VRCPVCGVQPFADEGPCLCVDTLSTTLAKRVEDALARGVDGAERADVERWLADLRDEQLAATVDEEKLVLAKLGHDRQDVALRP